MDTLDSDLLEQVNFCCELINNLPKYFMKADLQAKQQIPGSILADKLVFENNSYRTIPFRRVISLICRPGKCGAQDMILNYLSVSILKRLLVK
jgi:hypothetical protein